MSASLFEILNETTSWREQCISEALQAESLSGEGIDATLRGVLQNWPTARTLLVWVDRHQLVTYLNQQAKGYRVLTVSDNRYVDGARVAPYVGWFALEWEGETVEIALPPTTYGSGCAVFMGCDADALHRLSLEVSEFGLRPAGRCLKYAGHWHSAPDIDAEIGKITWDDVVIAEETLTEVRDCIEGFYRNREAFRSLGFAWRRGVLFVGPPGTGKTMLCKAAAASLPEMPFLYVRDLADDDNCRNEDAITIIFQRARKLSPCLLAFEDIDGLVTDMNRTAFLNELDGFRNNDGLLIIASSNHPEKIDQALLKRPSRFDRVFHIGLPAANERREYCRRILQTTPLADRLSADVDVEGLAERVARDSRGFSPAYIKEAIVSAGLSRAQAGADVLDGEFAKAVVQQISLLKANLRKLNSGESDIEFVGAGQNYIGIRPRR